ncbi:MAG TPA: DUF1003 domain-containing protein [Clostridia bacterium]|nr:DUF1003 domain-containing protein [Clostridia bacterium]
MDKDDLKDLIISDEAERENQIHELIKGKRSLNINKELCKTLTLGERMADKIAKFAGSWSFLIVFGGVILIWTIVNTKFILDGPFDPYPYVFLNLILACISSVQAPIIMMSQNRESQKERLRSENDYLINLKSEIILEDLHIKIDEIIKEQGLLKNELKDIKMEMDKTNGRLCNDTNGKSDTSGKEPGLYS